MQAEFVTQRRTMTHRPVAEEMTVTPILSWHEAEFVGAYDKGASATFAQRSPIERALVAFIAPHLAARTRIPHPE